jgi:Disulfide bond isomerase protein N-terminus
MPMDLPPSVPAPVSYAMPAPVCRLLSAADAAEALKRLRSVLPGTEFAGARPSEVCGMVRVELASGKVAYTDPTGRYLMLAFAIDTHRGGPADNQDKLDQALETRAQFPADAIPGVMPSPAPLDDDAVLMSPIPQAVPKPLPRK